MYLITRQQEDGQDTQFFTEPGNKNPVQPNLSISSRHNLRPSSRSIGIYNYGIVPYN